MEEKTGLEKSYPGIDLGEEFNDIKKQLYDFDEALSKP